MLPGDDSKWTITAEERKNYDRQFEQLGASGGFLRGDQVRPHFFRSNLPAPTLGQIWDLSDVTKDGKMDKHEFAIAMKLIQLKIQGSMLPKTLPASMKNQAVKFDISSFAQTSFNTSAPSSKEEVSLLSSMTAMPKPVTSSHSGGSVFPNSMGSNTLPRMGNSAGPIAMTGYGNTGALVPTGIPGMSNAGTLRQTSMPGSVGLGSLGTNTMPGVGSTGALGLNNMQGLGTMGPMGVKSMPGMANNASMYNMPHTQTMTAAPPTPVHAFQGPALDPTAGSLKQSQAPPGGSPPSDWAVPKPSKLKYNQLFNANDIGKSGFVSGMAARHLLKQTGLPEPILAQIWDRSDIDKDGKLTQEEFVLAMHLTDIARSGNAVPAVLPPELIPPSYRRNAAVASGSAPILNNANALTSLENLNLQDKTSATFATFEDRKRDNFNKGNIELEKRRLALLEQQKKEQERIEKKERELREKRERERREQEMRRQAELERQIEMQQAAEREREEARRKAVEQREAAQRELERQTRLEFERVKRQELLHQKLREQEAVTSLHAKTKEMDVEIATLKEKRGQLQIRVSDLEAREKEQKAALDTMDQSRYTKSTAVTLRQNELKELNNKFDRLLPEKQGLLDRMRDVKENENFDNNSSVKSTFGTRQKTLLEMKAAVEKNQSESATKLIEFKKLNIQLNDLREEVNRHRLEVEAMNRVQQDKVRELQEARRAKEASLMRKNSTEKIKSRKQQKTVESIQKGSVDEKRQQIQQQLQNLFEKKDKTPNHSDPFANTNAKNEDLFGGTSDVFGSGSWNKADAFGTAQSNSDAFGTAQSNSDAFGTAQSNSDAFGTTNTAVDAFGSGTDLFGSNTSAGETDMFRQTSVQSSSSSSIRNTPTMTEEEIKRENVKKKIAEMQQKRLEQKRLQDSSGTTEAKSQVKLSKFRAVYDFTARNDDELTLKCGDIVMVNEKEDIEPGWYSGILNGKKGLFPANYVEKVANEVQPKGDLTSLQVPQPAKRTPSQSTAKNNSTTSDGIHSKDKSAFTLTGAGRHIDSSPIPGQGEKISNFKCQALYPWKAKKDNHLTFEQDAIIEVTEQQAMWWFGSADGKSGWFPKAYVRELSSTPTDAQPVVKGREAAKPNEAANTVSKPQEKGQDYIATYAFTSQEDGDLSFQAGETITVTEMDGDWWKGTTGNRTGIFPANYVSPKSETPAASNPPPASGSSASSREIADVIAAYSASSPNQLSLKTGQLVLVKKKSDSGWWEGELQARGKKKQVGWFPADYVKLRTPNQPKPKTLCRVMAMYDYSAQNEDEISFPRGTVINVIDKTDPDWWKGSTEANPNDFGLFPNNYVREINKTESSGSNLSNSQWPVNPQ